MKVKFKALREAAILPSYANPGDAGLDIYALDGGRYSPQHNFVEYRTGIAVEIPEGYVGLIFPRSSISTYALTLTNCVGVIDSGFRGEITFRFREVSHLYPRMYKQGDRIGQLVIMPYPSLEAEWAETLTKSTRGDGGYGSSGA